MFDFSSCENGVLSSWSTTNYLFSRSGKSVVTKSHPSLAVLCTGFSSLFQRGIFHSRLSDLLHCLPPCFWSWATSRTTGPEESGLQQGRRKNPNTLSLLLPPWGRSLVTQPKPETHHYCVSWRQPPTSWPPCTRSKVIWFSGRFSPANMGGKWNCRAWMCNGDSKFLFHSGNSIKTRMSLGLIWPCFKNQHWCNSLSHTIPFQHVLTHQ